MLSRLSDRAQTVHVRAGGRQVRMSLARLGSAGPTRPRLLLLHGNPADMNDWEPLAHELAEFAELVAVDLPGFGRSDSAARTDASLLTTFADCVYEAVESLGWSEEIYALGHSHGAGVAQALAVRHPSAVAGLILLASIGSPATATYRQLAWPGVPLFLRFPALAMRFGLTRRLMRGVLRGIMRPMFRPQALPELRVEQQLAAFGVRPQAFVEMSRLARDKPSEQLARDAFRIRAPVLFIHGEQDELVPIAHARAISALLDSASPVNFEVLPGVGHMLHCTHAPWVSHRIASWLELRRATGTSRSELPRSPPPLCS